MIETSQCFAGTRALHQGGSVHLRPHISVRSIMCAIERVRGPLEWELIGTLHGGPVGEVQFTARGRETIEVCWGQKFPPDRRLVVRNLGRGIRALYPCTYVPNAVIVLPDGRLALKTKIIGTADPVVRKSEITFTRPPDVPSGTGPPGSSRCARAVAC